MVLLNQSNNEMPENFFTSNALIDLCESLGSNLVLHFGSNLINSLKNFFCPIFFWNLIISFLNFEGILGILANPSVNDLKYNPVPPTIIGVFFLLSISSIFLFDKFNQCPTENFFFTEWNTYKWCLTLFVRLF